MKIEYDIKCMRSIFKVIGSRYLQIKQWLKKYKEWKVIVLYAI
jgi:hypothetical protein